jgi:hypothetical protein
MLAAASSRTIATTAATASRTTPHRRLEPD